jgi:hypothetical protein
MNSRREDLRSFYKLIGELKDLIGSGLSLCVGELASPGVYFFVDPKEPRSDTGKGSRVVYVGKADCLGSRLSDHWWRSRETSQFRQVVGEAIIKSRELNIPSWAPGNGYRTRNEAARTLNNLPKQVAKEILREYRYEIDAKENPIEKEVGQYICSMSVRWITINNSDDRRKIERNSIALLSNHHPHTEQLDRHSSGWLGCHGNEKLFDSGLWCEITKIMYEMYDPGYLKNLAGWIKSRP